MAQYNVVIRAIQYSALNLICRVAALSPQVDSVWENQRLHEDDPGEEEEGDSASDDEGEGGWGAQSNRKHNKACQCPCHHSKDILHILL